MRFLKQLQYHHLFLFIGFIFGLKLVFVNPPWHSNDEDRHFYNAYNLSEGHLGPQTQDNKCGYVLPVALVKDVGGYKRLPFNDTVKIRSDAYDEFTDKALDADHTEFLPTPTCKLMPFVYIPSAIFIKLGSVLNSSPIWLGWWARIGSLIAYLLITFLAIKKLPVFKPLLMLVALSPMALYQGASVTYDSLSFAFLFLFFALLLAYYFQEQKITGRQVVILFFVALAQRLAKDGYFIMFFSMMFIPLSKFENKKVYLGGIALLLFASFVPSHLWTFYLNHLHLPPEEPLQTDYLFDVSKSLQFNSKDPIHAIGLLLSNIKIQGRVWIQGSIGMFGSSYTQIPFWLAIVQICSMIFVVIAESKNKMIAMQFRLPVILLAFANCLAILVMFFLAATPVGGHAIHGVQGRYFTPLLPFIFVFLFFAPQHTIKSEWLRWVVPVYTSLMLMYIINFLTVQYYN